MCDDYDWYWDWKALQDSIEQLLEKIERGEVTTEEIIQRLRQLSY